MDATLRILDQASGEELRRCSGPAPDGSCPRVTIGATLPCAGHELLPEGATGQPYMVSAAATMCPVTVVAALAVPVESVLVGDD